MKTRLIDADALKTDLTRFYDNEVTAKRLIDEQPTIDAIPVEWLKGLMLSTEDDVDKVEFAWILREWESEQKEQEAR